MGVAIYIGIARMFRIESLSYLIATIKQLRKTGLDEKYTEYIGCDLNVHEFQENDGYNYFSCGIIVLSPIIIAIIIIIKLDSPGPILLGRSGLA